MSIHEAAKRVIKAKRALERCEGYIRSEHGQNTVDAYMIDDARRELTEAIDQLERAIKKAPGSTE